MSTHPDEPTFFEQLIEVYSSEPEVSPQQHLHRKELELGCEMMERMRVYMDTRYWLLIRDHLNGRRPDKHVGELHELLRSLVSEGKAVCPVSVHTVSEVMKQDDPVTLSSTSKLMEELSDSVAIIPELRRIRREVRSFMNSGLIGSTDLPPLIQEVWTKPYWLYVSMDSPLLGEWPPEQRRAAMKASIDVLWGVTVSEYIQAKEKWPLKISFKEMHDGFPEFVASELNIDKPTPESIILNFHEQFLAELEIALDMHNNDIEGIFDLLYEQEHQTDVGYAAAQKSRAEAPITDWIRRAFREKRIRKELPFFRIIPGILAAYKHDRQRRYKANDLTDFYNAASGIPFCHIYLTEKSFRHLLTTKPLKFEQLFETQIISDPAEAVRAVRQLA